MKVKDGNEISSSQRSEHFRVHDAFILHIVLAGIHQPVFFRKSIVGIKLFNHEKIQGDPGESNIIRQLLHPVGPSLGSWLFGDE